MDRLQAIRVFSQVVESGSFSKAAVRLDISPTAASRFVAELEAHLNTRLLQRTTRRVNLTDSGRGFYERCVQILAELDDAEQEASQASAMPRGTIRLTTSINFGMRHVTPAIAAFLVHYPQVKFDVSLSDRVVDLVEEGFDLAIRIGTAGRDTLVARKLGETRLVPCASPAYLARHGTPATPEDLEPHNCLTYEYALRDQWVFVDAAGREHSVRVSGSLNSNNGDLLAEAAVQGVGIVCEPTFIVGPEIRAGRLVPILQEFAAPRSPIYAVYTSRKHLSARVRLFVDFLLERFGQTADFTIPALIVSRT
ncbi:MAG: LysR family transcriptional regulator [Betaproteobacteria bacterium]|nr:LysR family transcriptional regulator [Betaproteobacteria bacterium]